jgi:hypothetical protein
MASWCRSPIENIELAYRARADSFFAELKRLREVCAHAVDPGFATHPNYDHAKHLCAWNAFGLMRELSDGKITSRVCYMRPFLGAQTPI